MPRVGTTGNPSPYQFFGMFSGLAFWPGGLTLLAAAPGVGKTSWLLRMVFEASASGFPGALGCYEHTVEELKYRLRLQSEACVAGPHDTAAVEPAERDLARGSETVLLSLSDQEDTIRGVEDVLLYDYGFPKKGPALLAMDYLQRVPVLGLTGMIEGDQRAGEAAARLRALGRRHGWAVIAAAALRLAEFDDGTELSALWGDERVPYEADRVLVMRPTEEPRGCGCVSLEVHTLKDRTGPKRIWDVEFWGERFYIAANGESHGERH